jgi:hypothetical protein
MLRAFEKRLLIGKRPEVSKPCSFGPPCACNRYLQVRWENCARYADVAITRSEAGFCHVENEKRDMARDK